MKEKELYKEKIRVTRGGKKIYFLSDARKTEREHLYLILKRYNIEPTIKLLDDVITYFHKKDPMYASSWGGVDYDMKRRVFRRDRGRCNKCWTQLTMTNATLDHIIPRSLGGSDEEDNLCIMCEPCNMNKGNNQPI